jgi:hypothetical protein
MVSGWRAIRLLSRSGPCRQPYARQRRRGRHGPIGFRTVRNTEWNVLVAGWAMDLLFTRGRRETGPGKSPRHARVRLGDCGERQASDLGRLDAPMVAGGRLDCVSGRGWHRSDFAGWQVHAQPDFTQIPGLRVLEGRPPVLRHLSKHYRHRCAVAALLGEREIRRGKVFRAHRSSGLRGSYRRIQHPSRRQALPHLRSRVSVRHLDASSSRSRRVFWTGCCAAEGQSDSWLSSPYPRHQLVRPESFFSRSITSGAIHRLAFCSWWSISQALSYSRVSVV